MTFAENFFSREFLEQEILREAYGLIVGYLRQKRATVGVISKSDYLVETLSTSSYFVP